MLKLFQEPVRVRLELHTFLGMVNAMSRPLVNPPVPVGKRLRSKTTVPTPPVLPLTSSSPEVVVGVSLDEEADAKRGRRIYLVTLPRPKQSVNADGRTLVAPGSKTRKEILQIFLECCANPIHTSASALASLMPVPIRHTGVFRELHAEDDGGDEGIHDYLPVRAVRDFMYLPVKRALLERHGLASHWSCSHTGYWSVIRYLHHPTPKKPAASLDKEYIVWATQGEKHPLLQDCMNEPTTAAALEARRLKTDRQAAEKGKPSARISEIDIWPIVVRNNIRNTADDMNAAEALMAWAVDCASKPMVDFLFKHRARLNGLIDDIWKWQNVKEDLGHARLSGLQTLHKAVSKPCVCRGVWAHHVRVSFRLNGINAEELCCDILHSIESGRCESVPVIVLAGARGGEGKSLFLKALYAVFGEENVFSTPEKGNFAMVELPGKKAAFLDEWRFNDKVLSYAAQCLWFDGSTVTINRAQNVQGMTGHLAYRGTAPIFATGRLTDIQALAALAADNPATGTPFDSDASMLYRRLKVYPFTQRIPKPPPKTPFCGHCFAYCLLNKGSFPNHGAPVIPQPSGHATAQGNPGGCGGYFYPGGTWI